ncbi:MAG: protein kinase [Kofleriaceae bacterium]|nr:protein kinase [Kofleriaceae bacterium]
MAESMVRERTTIGGIPPSVPDVACPDDGMLAAFIERSLDELVADRLREHLDACDSCRLGVMQWVRQTSRPAAPQVGRPVSHELALGPFVLKRRLGAGGMGVVYAAFDTRLEREVAIKLLASAGDPRADRMLLDEARAQARVTHASVVTVYEVGEADGARYIAMELIRGRTLRAYLAARRPAVAELLALFARAAEGLAAAHALGVIHRDFKPDNVLVEEDPATGAAQRVVVSDFGLAARTDATALELALGSPGAGTPGYMAPEQYEGAAADARADIFAFAVALWEGLYKTLPFAVKSVGELRRALATPAVPPARPEVPTALRSWLVQALAMNPADRPAAIASVLPALAMRRPRRRVVAFGAAVTAGALVTVGAVATWRDEAITEPACDLELEVWHDAVPWEARAVAAGVPAWVRARVGAAMTARAHEVATRGERACNAAGIAERQAWAACRGEQAIVERETLEALAQPWPSYAHLGDALALPWVSTCATRAAQLSLVLAPASPLVSLARDAARAQLARIELAWLAGKPRAAWAPALAQLHDAGLTTEHQLLAAKVASGEDAARALPLLETAVAHAERSGDLVGAAHAWLGVARLRASSGGRTAKAAFEQASWAIERIGDPPALRAAWHTGMAGQAWVESDATRAIAHARDARALERSGGAPREEALAALASAAGANAKFGEQRRALEEMLEQSGETLDDVNTWMMYSEALYHLGENEPALRAAERARTLAVKLRLEDDPLYAQALLVRSFVELDLARVDACLATIAEVERRLARISPDHELVGATHNMKASALGAKRDWRGALAAAEAAAAFFTRIEGPRDFSALFARQQIAELAKQLNDMGRAEIEFRAVLADARVVFGPDDPRTAAAEHGLGLLLFETAGAAEARPLLEHAVAAFTAAEIDPKEAAQATSSLATLLLASPDPADRARARILGAKVRAAWQGDPYYRAELAAFEQVLARRPT